MATAKGEKFITIFIGRYNVENKHLEYINAGHNPPVFFNKSTKQLAFLSNGCVGLGMLDDIPVINLGTMSIDQPAKLICYTDGLVESIKNDKVEYNTRIVEESIINLESISDNIAKIAGEREDAGRAESQIFDDISILGFEFL
jgi:sigma-B regulation protein RsbU (phosphoserine phosphatase)